VVVQSVVGEGEAGGEGGGEGGEEASQAGAISMKAKTIINRLLTLRAKLAGDAMEYGRYEKRSYGAFLSRDKSAAFRCMAYQEVIRQIAALDKAIEVIQNLDGALPL